MIESVQPIFEELEEGLKNLSFEEDDVLIRSELSIDLINQSIVKLKSYLKTRRRYDLFINHKTKTHATTNINAGELEKLYCNRVRSRMREMFNLIAFDKETSDKRK